MYMRPALKGSRRLNKYLYLLIIIPLLSFGNNGSKNDLFGKNLNGQVKRVIIDGYSAALLSGEIQKEEISYQTIDSFDKDGHLITELYTDKKRGGIYIIKASYSAQGWISESATYDSSGSVIKRNINDGNYILIQPELHFFKRLLFVIKSDSLSKLRCLYHS